MVYVDIKGSKHHGEKKGAENALLEVNICWWILSRVCQLLYTNCTLKWPCTIYNNKKFVKFLTQTTCMYKVNRLVLQNWRLLTLVSGCRSIPINTGTRTIIIIMKISYPSIKQRY